MGVMAKACILTRVIGKQTTGSFKDANQAMEACATCARIGGKAGRKAGPRPCAVLLSDDGTTTIGFLPLPAGLRPGKAWEDVGYWIRE